MDKIILSKEDYTFNAGTRTVLFHNYNVTKHNLLLITNVTDNTIIYNFACDTHGGVITNNSILLDYNTTVMENEDDLQIVIYVDTHITSDKYLNEIRINTKVLNDIFELISIQNELIKQMF